MSLHLDYRPKTLNEVEGNRSTVDALKTVLARKTDIPHAMLFTGSSGCLHGDTVLYDPTDRSSISIEDRFLSAKPFHVISLNSAGIPVVAQALPPVQYSEDRMFRVETPESVFFVTYGHRFLLDTGQYLSLKELIENGYEEVRLRSNSVFCQEDQPQDAPHCLKITTSSQENYPAYCHSCGGQLLAGATDGQSASPLQDGVPGCNLVNLNPGVQGTGEEHTHRNQLSGPLSTLGSSPSAGPFDVPGSPQEQFSPVTCESGLNQQKISSKGVSSPCPHCNLPLSLNHFQGSASDCVSSFHKFLSASLPPVLNNDSGCGEPITTYTYIKQITEIAKEKYYDFHVPIYNNYWMGGVFHHNCGKTTLGRIVANHLGCADIDFREIDAGGERGIDAIREIRIQARLRPIGGPVRVWLLDEAHSYLGPAQNALLKILEDTPPHVYFILCTTDPEKLLKTIKSRCMQFNVAPLSEKQMTRLLKRIVTEEGVADFPEEAYQLIHQNSLGHVRAALVILDKVIDLPAQKLLAACEQAAGEEAQVIDLCRALIKGEKWVKVSALLRSIQPAQEAESVRYAVLGYMNSVLLKEDNPRVFLVMEAFREPFYNTGKPGLTFACYEAVKL